MDGSNPKKNKKTDWMEGLYKNGETGSNNEQNAIIDRYKKVLNILESVPINNENLVLIKKPLDDLESYLKYIPNGALFNDVLPTELKEKILSNLCDCNAFIAASVCQEWKKISAKRFKEKEVFIGEDWSRCEDKECVKPDGHGMIKAAATHKLDAHLVICNPVTEIDSQLVTDALIGVSKVTVGNFDYNDYEDEDDVPFFSADQFEHFFDSFEKEDKIMEKMKLVQLNLKDINQQKLVTFLVNKVKRLTLNDVIFDVNMFMTKLQQDSENLKLTHLTLFDFEFSLEEFGFFHTNLADSLCGVENVELCGSTFLDLENEQLQRLMEKLLQMPTVIKTLIITSLEDVPKEFHFNFGSLITPQDLKTVFSKMTTLQLEGIFTLEQLEAAGSLPDVEVSRVQFNNSEEFFHSVKKGSTEVF